MDYNSLLDVAVELGYQLAMSGAETFRVEESIARALDSYGIQAEVFAIPNCLHVSIETPEGEPITRMRRIGHHGNDLDAVEKFNSVSRRICREKPEPKIAAQWITDTKRDRKEYSLPLSMVGNYLVACGFTVLFGGSIRDSLFAGFFGLLVGLVNRRMNQLRVNLFFSIIIASFLMSFAAYAANAFNIIRNADTAIIGTLMLLVPGLLFTNALRDIIYGDTNSGTNRIVQVFLIAAAIALGTGVALKLTQLLWILPPTPTTIQHSIFIELVAGFIGSLGFAIVFNIQGPGSLLCAAGGVVTWFAYRCAQQIGSDVIAYFIATVSAALYAESMARIRKYPAISYLVISLIPLIPGAGIYYTMNHIVQNELDKATAQGTHTIALAGAIAVGILLISTIFRLISMRKRKR